MKQLGLGLNLSTKKMLTREFLEGMERVAPWDVLVQIVEPHYPKAKTGRPSLHAVHRVAQALSNPIHFSKAYMTKALMICLLAIASAASAQEIPKHLELARRLVDTVKPENNRYVYRGTQGVRLAGELFTSEDTINTMCSAFVTAMFERTKHPAIDKIKWGGEWVNGYLRVTSFTTAIEKGRGLDKVSNLKDVVPGDLFVFTCIDACASKEGPALGHVGLFDAIPERLEEPQEPLVPGTIQWKVVIVDVVDVPWNRTDTRYVQAGPKGQGVGRGSFRIYTDENGSPVGYKAGGPYWPNSKRSILLGHPQN